MTLKATEIEGNLKWKKYSNYFQSQFDKLCDTPKTKKD